MDEVKFPIYQLTAKWIEDGEHNEIYVGDNLGLPKGRTWNSIASKNIIKKEEMNHHELGLYAYEWWNKFKNSDKYKDKNVELVTCDMRYLEHEVWCLTWFQHETFDIGKTDEEVLKSFQEFVSRKQELNRKNGHQENDRNYDSKKPFHCLMGAEDRWRWKGVVEGDADAQTEPPCRCKHCKEQGMIRIGH